MDEIDLFKSYPGQQLEKQRRMESLFNVKITSPELNPQK